MFVLNDIAKKHKNIKKVNSSYIMRMHYKKKIYYKLFNFTEWRGQQNALNAAVSFRDQLKCVFKFVKSNNLSIKDW